MANTCVKFQTWYKVITWDSSKSSNILTVENKDFLDPCVYVRFGSYPQMLEEPSWTAEASLLQAAVSKQ